MSSISWEWFVNSCRLWYYHKNVSQVSGRLRRKFCVAKLCFYLQIMFSYRNKIFHLLCPISRGVRAPEITEKEGKLSFLRRSYFLLWDRTVIFSCTSLCQFPTINRHIYSMNKIYIWVWVYVFLHYLIPIAKPQLHWYQYTTHVPSPLSLSAHLPSFQL